MAKRRKPWWREPAALAEELGLVRLEVCCVNSDEPIGENAEVCEELDRTLACLCDAFDDLPRLLGDMHVERQVILRRETGRLFDPLDRERAHAVGGDADAHAGIVRPGLAQRLDIAERVVDAWIAEAALAGHGVVMA